MQSSRLFKVQVQMQSSASKLEVTWWWLKCAYNLGERCLWRYRCNIHLIFRFMQRSVQSRLWFFQQSCMDVKKAECQRIDAFELWCWRRLLIVSWTARRSNQLTLMEISPKYPLEGLMVKLKLQYFGHLMQRTNFLEKTLMLGKIESGRRRDNRG